MGALLMTLAVLMPDMDENRQILTRTDIVTGRSPTHGIRLGACTRGSRSFWLPPMISGDFGPFLARLDRVRCPTTEFYMHNAFGPRPVGGSWPLSGGRAPVVGLVRRFAVEYALSHFGLLRTVSM